MTDLPLITKDRSIRDCLRVIDSGARGIALVVDAARRLIGVITDGDVRRGLIRGLSLEAPVASVMGERFHSVMAGPSQQAQALHIMRSQKIAAVPVVDDQQFPVGLELLRETLSDPQPHDETVVIMAGGRGMRLRPLTQDVPKPMLHVRGKPMLQHIIEQLTDQGFGSFVITLNYLGEVIRKHFGDGGPWGVKITYTEERQPLGTAGALGLMNPKPNGTFVVMNGDVLSPFDPRRMIEHHREHGAVATMAVSLQRTDLAYGVVDTNDGLIRGIEEKPSMHHLVNAGLYVVEPSALSLIPNGKAYNMTDLFRDLIANGQQTRAFALHEDWVDIGQHEQYQKANDC